MFRGLVGAVLVSYILGSVLGVSELERCKKTLDQLRAAIECNECLSAQDESLVWSGGCNVHSRGGGWARSCLNDEQVNQKNVLGEYNYKVNTATNQLQVLRNGLYDILFTGHSYSQNVDHLWSTLHVNNAYHNYWHSNHIQGTAPIFNQMTWKLDANWVVWENVHKGGTDPIRVKSNRGSYGRNRLQVRYLGPFEKNVIFSGGYSAHIRTNAWTRLPLNIIEYNSALTQEHLSYAPDGRVTIKKEAYYRVVGQVMTHGHHCVKDLAIRIDGNLQLLKSGYNHGWRSQRADSVFHLKAGQFVEIWSKSSGGDPYAIHLHRTTNQHTARIQITKIGDVNDAKVLSAGPSAEVTSVGEHVMINDRVITNTMPAGVARIDDTPPVLGRGGGGVQLPGALSGDKTTIVIESVGWFRLATSAVIYTSNMGLHAGKITINDKTVAVSKESHQFGISTMQMDYTFRGARGDKIRIVWAVQGNSPNIKNADHKQTFFELVALSSH